MWSTAILAVGQARRFGGREKGAPLGGGHPIREREIDEGSKHHRSNRSLR
jgi:molybdopterin-guanine dinucleotide biosynthesis protein A